MPSPFPGMDPYLEEPGLWPDVHAALMTAIRAALTPALRPKYLARVEQRTFAFEPNDPAQDLYLVPDLRVVERPRERPGSFDGGGGGAAVAVAEGVEVTEEMTAVATQRYLQVLDVEDREVVTVIEIVSPSNKKGGAGQRAFEQKRDQVMASRTNWMEIDLIRRGRTLHVPRKVGPCDYLCFTDSIVRLSDLGAADDYRRRVMFPIGLRDRLPILPVPLRPEDDAVPLDLQAVLDRVYDEAAYDAGIDYAADPPPPELPDGHAAWLDGRLREAGLREAGGVGPTAPGG